MNPQPPQPYTPIALFPNDELPQQLFQAAIGVARGRYQHIKVMPLDFALDLGEGETAGYDHHVLFAQGFDSTKVDTISAWFNYRGERSGGGTRLSTWHRLPHIGDERLQRMGYAPRAVVEDRKMLTTLGNHIDDLISPSTLVLPVDCLLPKG